MTVSTTARLTARQRRALDYLRAHGGEVGEFELDSHGFSTRTMGALENRGLAVREGRLRILEGPDGWPIRFPFHVYRLPAVDS